ncbi:MAG: hypothetical protein AAF403_07975, partial [Pseudomonadota bacterium]
MPPGMPPGMQQPGMPPGMPPGMQQPGMPPGMPPGMQQPGVPPGMPPGMQQPGVPPGMPPGMQQPGVPPGMPPGMQQPGVPPMRSTGAPSQTMQRPPVEGNTAPQKPMVTNEVDKRNEQISTQRSSLSSEAPKKPVEKAKPSFDKALEKQKSSGIFSKIAWIVLILLIIGSGVFVYFFQSLVIQYFPIATELYSIIGLGVEPSNGG